MTLRHLVFHNFWIKFFSLALATAIWFAIKYVIQADLTPPQASILNPTQRSYQIPINVLAQPGDARIFKISPDTVVLTIDGESAVLRKYSPKDFRAYVDLTTIRTNEIESYEVRIHIPNDINIRSLLPKAVNVAQISP
jgi:YbbR domain-containing protein